MTLATPPLKSDGPDRFNTSPACHSHQEFVRSGQRDYMCCCNPCAYGKIRDALDPANHCCRCNPILIVFSYVPDDPEVACCYSERVPVFGRTVADANAKLYVEYTATIAGINVTLAISTGPINWGDGYEYDAEYNERTCYWTLRVPSLGILRLIEIDHTNVTCLGVPSFLIGGVITRVSCVGSIQADNFAATKVPFVVREFESPLYHEEEGLTLPIEGSYCYNCEEVARYLCLDGIFVDGGEREIIEFEWDYNYLAIQGQSRFGFVVGRWLGRIPKGGGFRKKIYLIEVDEGSSTTCKMFFDLTPGDMFEETFNLSASIAERAAELFDPLSLVAPDGAGCSLHELVGPIDPLVIAGFRITTGRCGCWQYHCGTCRCLPAYLCGHAFIDGVFFYNIRFEWIASISAWVSVSGTGTDWEGNVFSETISIAVDSDGYGECQVTWDKVGYTVEPQPFECGLVIGFNFSGYNADRSQYAYLFAFSAFGPCDEKLRCSGASPCDLECGGHPEALMLTAHGYNDPYEDEPGIIGDCLIEIPLFFVVEPALVGLDPPIIEFPCRYIGMSVYESLGKTMRIEAEIKNGVLTMLLYNVTDGGGGGTIGSYTLDYETCNPYYAEYFERLALTGCPWATDQIIQRLQIDIVEIDI